MAGVKPEAWPPSVRGIEPDKVTNMVCPLRQALLGHADHVEIRATARQATHDAAGAVLVRCETDHTRMDPGMPGWSPWGAPHPCGQGWLPPGRESPASGGFGHFGSYPPAAVRLRPVPGRRFLSHGSGGLTTSGHPLATLRVVLVSRGRRRTPRRGARSHAPGGAGVERHPGDTRHELPRMAKLQPSLRDGDLRATEIRGVKRPATCGGRSATERTAAPLDCGWERSQRGNGVTSRLSTLGRGQ